MNKLIYDNEIDEVNEIALILDGLIRHEDKDKINNLISKIELLDSLVDRLKVVQSGKLTHGFCPCCGKREN
jgi:hypothetical protein